MLRRFGTIMLLIACAACSGGEPPPAQVVPTSTPIPTAPAAAPPTYVVQRGDVQELLRFSGRWQPRDQQQLSFEIAGTIRRVNVRRGDTVTAGQLLADYQITDLENQLASAQLELESAQANAASGAQGEVKSVTDAQINLANARLQLENTKASSPWTQLENARINLQEAKQALENAQRAYDDAISRPDEPNTASTVDRAYETLQRARNSVRTAQTSYYQAAQNFNNHQFDVAQRENGVVAAQLALGRAVEDAGLSTGSDNVRATQLRIDQIKGNIARSSLYAPFAGEVLEVTIKPGDRVEAFVAVITIGKPEPKEAVASLSFNDAQRLSVGLVGVCQIINQADTAVQCVVRRLPVSARDSDQTTRVAAILKTATSGQLVEVQMPLQVRNAVLWLPPVAVRTFQNRTFVVLQTPDGPRRADVEIGLRTDDRVEIESGVREGDVAIGP